MGQGERGGVGWFVVPAVTSNSCGDVPAPPNALGPGTWRCVARRAMFSRLCWNLMSLICGARAERLTANPGGISFLISICTTYGDEILWERLHPLGASLPACMPEPTRLQLLQHWASCELTLYRPSWEAECRLLSYFPYCLMTRLETSAGIPGPQKDNAASMGAARLASSLVLTFILSTAISLYLTWL